MFIGDVPPSGGVRIKRGPNGQAINDEPKKPRRTEPDEKGARGYIIERDPKTGQAKAWNG